MKGYDIALATSASEAIDVSQRRMPDVVVLDQHLPDMEGLDLLEHLRRRSDDRKPAAIFTADWEVADDAERIARLDAMFASKLCDIDEVELLVASALKARHALRERTLRC